jgi:SAM-dependent methyltransferase
VDPAELACTTALLATYDDVVKCRTCGLFYTSPRPDDAELLAGYGEVADRAFLDERRGRELTWARELAALERLAPSGKGRLLDAGCSMGFFMKSARDAGWEVKGIDPSRWAAEYGRREFGLDIAAGPIARVPIEPSSFDVVTVWDAVEHFVDPVGDMGRLARALKPGGLLALSTHSLRSLAAVVLGRRYPFLMAMHVTHFTPRTTALLLAKCGLVQFRVRPHVRYIRTGYVAGKLDARIPWAGRLARRALGALGLSGAHVPVVGLGIFDAFARKPA